MEKIPTWLPDWQDEDSYDFPGKGELRLWAWEFLRRNSEYQKAWLDHYVNGELRWVSENLLIEPGEKRRLHNNECVRKYNVAISKKAAEEGRIVTVIRGTKPREPTIALPVIFTDKFGLDSIHLTDPAINKPSDDMLSFKTQCGPPITSMDMQSRNNQSGMLPKSPSEVVTKLNLDYPLEEQLKRLKKILIYKREYLANLGKVNKIAPRVHGKPMKNYPNYLRILDARLHGVNFPEIGAILFPELSNEYPDFFQSVKAKDDFVAATSLRDEGFKYLCLRLISKSNTARAKK